MCGSIGAWKQCVPDRFTCNLGSNTSVAKRRRTLLASGAKELSEA